MPARPCSFRQLVDRADLPEPISRKRMDNFKAGSGTFRMNVALSELPDFTVLPGKTSRRASHLRHHHLADARLHGSSAFVDAKAKGWSEGADRRDEDPDLGR